MKDLKLVKGNELCGKNKWMNEWIIWRPCPQRNQSSSRKRGKIDKRLGDHQKATAKKHSWTLWALQDLAFPERCEQRNQQSQGWTLARTSQKPISMPCYRQPLPLTPATSPYYKTPTTFGKTPSYVPRHRNKSQMARANNEATLTGKVECWSGTETLKSNNQVAVTQENKAPVGHLRACRHTSKFKFPEPLKRTQE